MNKNISLFLLSSFMLYAMESDESCIYYTSSPDSPEPDVEIGLPPSTEQPLSEPETEEVSRRVLSLYFNDGQEEGEYTFTKDLLRRMNEQMRVRRGSVITLLQQNGFDIHTTVPGTQGASHSSSPDLRLRREMRNFVLPALDDVFTEHDAALKKEQENVNALRIKTRLAIIAAVTTVCTTTIATVTTIITSILAARSK